MTDPSRRSKYHPDKNKAADAEEVFKEVGKAYQILSDAVSLLALRSEQAGFTDQGGDAVFRTLERCTTRMARTWSKRWVWVNKILLHSFLPFLVESDSMIWYVVVRPRPTAAAQLITSLL